LVRGISLAVAEGLRAEGIRTFAEMAGCPASRWKGVAGHLGVEEAAASGDWMGQARDLAFLSDLARRGAEGSGWTDPGVAARVVQDAEEWGDWVRVDPELGLVFDLRPETTDRLTEIEGVSESVAEALGTIGIWQFRQIARWTDGQVEGIASRLGIPVRQIEAQAWVARAALRHRCIYRASPIWGEARPAAWRYEELLNQYPLRDAVETDETRGVVFLRAPEERDDLTRIEGIEAGLAERLEEAGVFRYRQVADWSEANAEVFAARLGIPLARIYRERWIPQARRMLA
jgi:predicted flap endonuclease-1-like 5' DNA nuclease